MWIGTLLQQHYICVKSHEKLGKDIISDNMHSKSVSLGYVVFNVWTGV